MTIVLPENIKLSRFDTSKKDYVKVGDVKESITIKQVRGIIGSLSEGKYSLSKGKWNFSIIVFSVPLNLNSDIFALTCERCSF